MMCLEMMNRKRASRLSDRRHTEFCVVALITKQAEIGFLRKHDFGGEGYGKLTRESIGFTFQLLSTLGGMTMMHDFWGYFCTSYLF